MDVCYYTAQVKDELDGADEYLSRAMVLKKTKPEHSAMLYKMSDAELSHASDLIKMFEDDYRTCTEKLNPIPDIYPEMRASILTMYTDRLAVIKAKQQKYQAT